jgi:glutamate dehydrogenase (NAD(P)+)
MRVIAVSDAGGAVYNPAGLDQAALSIHVRATGTVAGFALGSPIDPASLWSLECELAVPAALGGVITAEVASGMGARVLVEAANGPTTPDADPVLASRGVLVVPDILANAGGVTVSYFEWVQDLQEFFWEESEINSKLRHIMTKAFHEVVKTHAERGLTMRTAAYVLAVDKVARATSVRGIYP